MKSIKSARQLMEELGFRAEARESTQLAYLNNLLKSASEADRLRRGAWQAEVSAPLTAERRSELASEPDRPAPCENCEPMQLSFQFENADPMRSGEKSA